MTDEYRVIYRLHIQHHIRRCSTACRHRIISNTGHSKRVHMTRNSPRPAILMRRPCPGLNSCGWPDTAIPTGRAPMPASRESQMIVLPHRSSPNQYTQSCMRVNAAPPSRPPGAFFGWNMAEHSSAAGTRTSPMIVTEASSVAKTAPIADSLRSSSSPPRVYTGATPRDVMVRPYMRG